ncbi:D-alanyl-D-alanine carboxypeptidase family protein [Clostridium sp. CF012]|uniref:D-alanyl-D-alanine carboxypeptidase family protein n=1 Tax=Clostridium sp. CF012 TaxID=2843319 RepID=UPI001C0BBC85|nr:D-alanyl-D-alanine carboxypeptidase [Clostridium sp. CF012]MBU3145517.1 D-alanyl-D-alanine carboxypeptidase [Clostridium sp. CF012]
MRQKKEKKKSKFRVLLLIIIVIGIVFSYKSNIDLKGQFIKGQSLKGQSSSKKVVGDKASPVLSLTVASDADLSKSLDKLNSPNAILVRLDNHSILMEKNGSQKIYPASLTKIMTAIVAIEKLPDLQENIKLPSSMFRKLHKADASMAGFQPDEKVRAIDLLYGVMLPSGAECSIGLANSIAGSEQKFVDIMNEKAEVLGMKGTHFTNTTGLQDDNHYTTVKDLAVLLSYALQNKTFRDIFTSSRYSTSPTNKNPDGITFYSTMFKNIVNQVIDGGKMLGGKTGYTNEAGLCLASLAQKDGKEYIFVTVGANGNHGTPQYNIDDAYAVYNKLGKY